MHLLLLTGGFLIRFSTISKKAQAVSSAGKRKRCYLCPRGNDKEVRLACVRCEQPLRPSHSVQQVLCEQCV